MILDFYRIMQVENEIHGLNSLARVSLLRKTNKGETVHEVTPIIKLLAAVARPLEV